MKAIVHDRYGPPDVLSLKEIQVPKPGDGEVRLRVHAAGVDMGVWHMVTGTPRLIRLGIGVRGPRSPVPGIEVSGVVDAVGPNVTTLKPGDAVYGAANGSFAEFAVAKQDKLARMPANVTFEQAAAAPTSGTTALHAVRTKGKVKAGQRVLVIGAGGGIGSFAVQLAKAFGAVVTGVCSTAKTDFVRSLGADDVIDYTTEDFADRTTRFDLIIDLAGLRTLSHLRRSLTPKGTLVLVGGEGGGNLVGGGLKRSLRARMLKPFTKDQTLAPLISIARTEDLDALRELIESGKVTPAVDRTYPLAEAAEAVRRLEQADIKGKVAVKP
jgi:2-desacetyl-2-hydroxyethyl bacteriochlorophyllide A dehydrogenase